MADSVLAANKYKFFTVGAVGTFMATLDGSILNVALPTISEKLNAPVSLVAWVVLSYSLTLISLMLLFGAWTERKGYSFSYKFGYYFFIGGSILCAFSNSIYMLIFARVVQAIGTSMFSAIGPGMVAEVFPDSERGKGMGLMMMMVAAGFMFGPPIGGFMLSVWSWKSLFLINVPIGLFGLTLVQKYFKLLPPHQSKRKVPIKGGLAISIALTTGVFMLKELDGKLLSDPMVWGFGLVSIIALIVFLKSESNPQTALIGLTIFRNRTFTTSILSSTMQFVSTSGVFVLIPFYLERVRGFEPKQVGMFLIILPILMFVFAPLAGKLSDRIGSRVLTTFGMVVTALGMFMFSGLQVDSSNLFIIGSLILVGIGIGTFSTPNSSAIMGSVHESQRAVTSGILATNRNIGMSVGIALSTALYSYFDEKNALISDAKLRFVTSYRPVIFVGVALAVVGVAICLVKGEESKAHNPVDIGRYGK
jgi:EmrB/QacA subfamily drug resistance transporter